MNGNPMDTSGYNTVREWNGNIPRIRSLVSVFLICF